MAEVKQFIIQNICSIKFKKIIMRKIVSFEINYVYALNKFSVANQ